MLQNCLWPFIKGANPILVKPPLNFNGGLAERGLGPSIKHAIDLSGYICSELSVFKSERAKYS